MYEELQFIATYDEFTNTKALFINVTLDSKKTELEINKF